MKTFLQSLYGRVSITYLFLLLVFSAMSVFATLEFAGNFARESDQELNRDLAQVFRDRVLVHLGNYLDQDALKAAFTDFMTINPRVDIYLVDTTGLLVASSVDTKELQMTRISVDPIHRFLGENRTFPIEGDDPRSAGQRKIFSVAPVELEPGRNGYVYVVLLSKLYDSVSTLLRDDYIIRTAIVNLALAFAFTGIAGLLILAFITKRFRAITRTVREFEQGNLKRRIEEGPPDELGQLSRTINQMAATVEANLADLQQRDNLRREFIANISHDLRSPLTSIQGYVETAIMKDEKLTPEERLQYLEIILNQTNHLSTMISQLLELSKLDASEAHPELEAFSPGELIQDIRNKFGPFAQKQNIFLETDLPHDLPPVHADIGMIERLLSNLVDNSIRHTPSGGRIEIRGTNLGAQVQIDVRDSGCGIPPEEIPRITERFYKGRNAGSRASGGTGLGLAIASRILQLHGSNLLISSEPGKGTTISFSLKAAIPDPYSRIESRSAFATRTESHSTT